MAWISAENHCTSHRKEVKRATKSAQQIAQTIGIMGISIADKTRQIQTMKPLNI